MSEALQFFQPDPLHEAYYDARAGHGAGLGPRRLREAARQRGSATPEDAEWLRAYQAMHRATAAVMREFPAYRSGQATA
jgi:hypothetical protein